MRSTSRVAPGPLPTAPGRLHNTHRLITDAVGLVTELTARHGDIFRLPLLNTTMVVITNPDYLKQVLQDRMANFSRRTDPYEMVEPFLGRGLATIADHDRWRRNRRLAQPAFHRKKIAALGDVMTAAVDRLCADWSARTRTGESIIVNEHMSRLALEIVVEALFGLDPSTPEILRFERAVDVANVELGRYVRAPFVPLKIPTPGHRRFWRAIGEMDDVVYGFIERFRDDSERRDGLLPMFMHAVDSETGQTLTDRELRDEVITMLLAGHETTAETLTWAMMLLHQHPDVLERVRDEAVDVLSGRTATIADLPRLTYGKQVLEEVLRLYPGAWNAYRRAEADEEIGQHPIPAGTQLMHSIFHAHRHPDFWHRPEEFDPDRFTAGAAAARDRHAYLPFGIGGHQCIGNVFAMTEMQIALATLVQRFDATISNPDPTPTATLTLTTKTPVVATLTLNRRVS
jgi:cytochrome P450